MKLYYAPGACSLAVHIVLEWIGAPYEAQAVKSGSPELLKVNPSGAVPALDTGEGWILTQAAAILRHLARAHPQAQLAGGEGLRDQAELDRWLASLPATCIRLSFRCSCRSATRPRPTTPR